MFTRKELVVELPGLSASAPRPLEMVEFGHQDFTSSCSEQCIEVFRGSKQGFPTGGLLFWVKTLQAQGWEGREAYFLPYGETGLCEPLSKAKFSDLVAEYSHSLLDRLPPFGVRVPSIRILATLAGAISVASGRTTVRTTDRTRYGIGRRAPRGKKRASNEWKMAGGRSAWMCRVAMAASFNNRRAVEIGREDLVSRTTEPVVVQRGRRTAAPASCFIDVAHLPVCQRQEQPGQTPATSEAMLECFPRSMPRGSVDRPVTPCQLRSMSAGRTAGAVGMSHRGRPSATWSPSGGAGLTRNSVAATGGRADNTSVAGTS
jgi:hypothetical protein